MSKQERADGLPNTGVKTKTGLKAGAYTEEGEYVHESGAGFCVQYNMNRMQLMTCVPGGSDEDFERYTAMCNSGEINNCDFSPYDGIWRSTARIG